MKRQKRVTVLFMMSVMMAVAGSAPAFGRGGEHPFLDALRAKRAGSSGGSTGTTQDPVMSTEPVLQAGDSVGGGGMRGGEVKDQFGGRDILLYVPKRLPPAGKRAIVVAMHGGGGNARFMQSKLKTMDATAEKYGFIVAYMNGTKAAPMLPDSMKSWNSGDGCCGMAGEKKVDDVGYMTNAVAYLTRKYGVDGMQVYAIGHSNGSLLSQLMLCTTNVFQAGVTMSGPVNSAVTSCPAAKGKRILAIHGVEDLNVPIIGGHGTKGPDKVRKDTNFRAEASAKQLFEQYGASYTLDALADTDHALEHLNETVIKTEGISIAEKAARFYGLAR